MRSLLLLFISLSASANEWSGPYQFGKFPKTFQAGYDIDDEPIYIGMVLDKGDVNTLFSKASGKKVNEPNINAYQGTWVVGKLNEKFKGVRYGLNDKENYAAKYLVFKPADPNAYRWVGATDGDVPENAVTVWGKEQRYICRAKWYGGIFPGTLIKSKKVCTFGFAGIEKSIYVYEVLVKH